MSNKIIIVKDGYIIAPTLGKVFTLKGREVGSVNDGGYLKTSSKNNKQILLHRLIYEAYYDVVPTIIDHINGIRADNRIENLREVDASGNSQNRAANKSNILGYKGVWKNPIGRYRACIHLKNKTIHLGTHDTPELAALAYNNAATQHFGEYARLNVIG